MILSFGLLTNTILVNNAEAAKCGKGKGEKIILSTKANWKQLGTESSTLRSNAINIAKYNYVKDKIFVKAGCPVLKITAKYVATNKNIQ